MPTTITRSSDGATTTPTLILGYETRDEGRTIVHDLIGGGLAVVLVDPRPRSGTLQLFYPEELGAWDARTLLRAKSTFTLVDTDRPVVGMTFVVTDLTLTLDEKTRQRWVLAVQYQEIAP